MTNAEKVPDAVSDQAREPPELVPVSIIIPTLNEERYLPVLLGSLKNVAAPMEIIVVDGSSTDRTVQVVEEYKPRFAGAASLRLISGQQRNIAHQRNIGAAAATHDILIFCDADVAMPSREHYAGLISQFVQQRLAVAAPVFVPIEPGLRVKLIFKFVHFLQRVVLLTGRPYFGGGYLMTTKDIFTKLEGFRTKLSLGEDIDYSLRASRLGPYQLIDMRVSISARRVIHYGYGWIFESLPSIVRFILTGFIRPEDIHYPFGEYNKPAERRSKRRSRRSDAER